MTTPRKPTQLPFALTHFDDVPLSALVPLLVLSKLSTRLPASLYRDVKAGRLRTRKVGSSTVVTKQDCLAYMAGEALK